MASKHHTFRIPDGVWAPALHRARGEGTTVTAVLLKFLTRYGATPPRQQGQAEQSGGNSDA